MASNPALLLHRQIYDQEVNSLLRLPPPPIVDTATSLHTRDEAERHAVADPRRARMIRLKGEVSPACGFEAPDEDLMYAIINGDSRVLRAFDPASSTGA